MFTESYAYGIMCVANLVSGHFRSNRRLKAMSRRLLSAYHAPSKSLALSGATVRIDASAARDEALELVVSYGRSDLKPTRSSSLRNFGCSNAAKCPPFGSRL